MTPHPPPPPPPPSTIVQIKIKIPILIDYETDSLTCNDLFDIANVHVWQMGRLYCGCIVTMRWFYIVIMCSCVGINGLLMSLRKICCLITN